MLTPWPESDVSKCLSAFLPNKLSEIGQSWWVSKFKLADSRKRLFCKQLSHKCTSTYAETANAGFEYGAILNYSNDQALEGLKVQLCRRNLTSLRNCEIFKIF